MISLLWSSRIAIALSTATVVYITTTAWCYVDKTYAVRAAKEGLATKIEMQALKAERDEAQRLAALAEKAHKDLVAEVDRAEANEQIAKEELEKYAKEFEVNDACVVDANLIERLLNK